MKVCSRLLPKLSHATADVASETGRRDNRNFVAVRLCAALLVQIKHGSEPWQQSRLCSSPEQAFAIGVRPMSCD